MIFCLVIRKYLGTILKILFGIRFSVLESYFVKIYGDFLVFLLDFLYLLFF